MVVPFGFAPALRSRQRTDRQSSRATPGKGFPSSVTVPCCRGWEKSGAPDFLGRASRPPDRARTVPAVYSTFVLRQGWHGLSHPPRSLRPRPLTEAGHLARGRALVVLATPTPVRAECPYFVIPPASDTARTAREVIVGTVVPNFNEHRFDFRVCVDHVLHASDVEPDSFHV